MLSIRLLKIWLSSILRTHSLLLLPQLGGVGLLQLHLHPPPHILYWVEVRAVALADWLVCESNALTLCQMNNFHNKMGIFCLIQPGGPL